MIRHEAGTRRFHWSVKNSNAVNRAPFSKKKGTVIKCQQRARPTEWRYPGSPTIGFKYRASSLAVQIRSSGTFTGVNRIHSESGEHPLFQYRRGWSASIERPLRIISIKKKKLTQWLRHSQAGKPLGEAAVNLTRAAAGSRGIPNTRYCSHAMPTVASNKAKRMTSI